LHSVHRKEVIMPKNWHPKAIRTGAVLMLSAVLLLAVFGLVSGWIEQGLWMRQVHYSSVFWHLFTVRLISFGVAFLVAFFYLWINVRLLVRFGRSALATARKNEWTQTASGLLDAARARWLSAVKIVPALIVAIGFGALFYGGWDTYLRFRFGGSFGLADPIFGKDVGFYVFRLPFYQLIQNSLNGLTGLTLVLVALGYISLGLVQRGQMLFRSSRILGHLSLLTVPLLASVAWGFVLDRYELLFSSRGVVFGAGYTDARVTTVSLWVMAGVTVALGGVLAAYWRSRRTWLLGAGFGAYVVAYIIAIPLVPSLVQRFDVAPDELQLETPYLRTNIAFTRRAYKLGSVKQKRYPGLADLTRQNIEDNQDTVDNIRLWDWRPILRTYRQTQEIRLYYHFYDVDVDRYRLDDGYHQLMVAARELAAQLPRKARTWVNERLQFTHGYGLVTSFVSKNAEGGMPEFLLHDIPPHSSHGLKVARPAVYYGERMPGYRIVDTSVKEFDYPKGERNVYTHYRGPGGIPLDSLWKRLLFSWTRGDLNILLTSYFTPQSRIQLWRTVRERVSEVAPFLKLDSDPYPVLSQGHIYWIQDAYTTSERFPYSQPHGALNYIRNSVKVVVDAYSGDVSFYVADPDDPVLAAYRRAFPGVFHNLGQLSPDLRQHLRYPEDLFAVQTDIYRAYHMTDPQVYYNQEDLWTASRERYAGESIAMRPYYVLVRLPGTAKLQYLLMTPFTPDKRDNMIAWMAAKCDQPEYGQLEVYRLPKERLVYGPIQVEAMIDQNTRISEQISLWDQRGSRVIRGNLLVIPLERSFLFVEPVYLTAESTSIPQLKRVIVATGDRVVMRPSLAASLRALFASPAAPVAAAAPRPSPDLARARRDLRQAEQSLLKGGWAKFGQAMQSLKETLTPGSTSASKDNENTKTKTKATERRSWSSGSPTSG
jgi:uncharacterized membrane protein (UPF0182 family)